MRWDRYRCPKSCISRGYAPFRGYGAVRCEGGWVGMIRTKALVSVAGLVCLSVCMGGEARVQAGADRDQALQQELQGLAEHHHGKVARHAGQLKTRRTV